MPINDRKGVNAIFNLQEPGEHPFCGDGINLKTGFSYNAETLMGHGVSYFNFFWKDLTNPSFEKLLNIVQVMDFIIKQGGKVLVHCHAGQGRTAVVIGAYLIYAGLASNDKEAVAITKKGRMKCFSKGYNQECVRKFHEDLIKLRMIFPYHHQHQHNPKAAPHGNITLHNVMQKQSMLLHGEERRFIRFMPKVIH